MDPEIAGNLLDRRALIATAGDANDVITELSWERFGHSDILSSRPDDQPDQVSPIHAADPAFVSGDPILHRFEAITAVAAHPHMR
jgi:hypothetical protein